VLDPAETGDGGGPHSMGTPAEEGAGQRVMLIGGTFIEMRARARGVRPTSTNIIWTYTLRVNEADSNPLVQDSFDLRLVAEKLTTGFAVHVNKGDRISVKSHTDVILGTTSCPWVGFVFVKD
jgi:hypothetical protein